MIRILKPLSFLPAIFIMYMIFMFSGQDGATSAQLSYKVTYKAIEVGGEILGADFEPWETDRLVTRFHGAIRKLAHMTEYFALAIAVAFPLYVYGMRGILLMFAAGFICVAFACGDEYHQAFVADRGPSKRDVLIDSFGVFWGIILVRIIGWTSRKTILRPFTKEKTRESIESTDYGKTQQQYFERQEYPGQPPYSGQQQYPGQPPYQRQRANPAQPPYYRPQASNYAVGQPNNNYYTSAQQNQEYYRQQPPYRQYNRAPLNHYETSSYGITPEEDYEDKEFTTSDQLSEDMSFRKLMSDLKDQKQARHKARKPKTTSSQADA